MFEDFQETFVEFCDHFSTNKEIIVWKERNEEYERKNKAEQIKMKKEQWIRDDHGQQVYRFFPCRK